jgi:hypothetical protein
MVHPASLECSGGQIVPRLIKASHEPGTCGNPPGPNTGQGHITALRADGWVEVPADIPATAWGVDRTQEPDILATYLNDHHGVNARGEPVVYVADAWDQPVSVGGVTRWQRDQAGFVAWRVSLIRELGLGMAADGGLSDEQVLMAVEPLIAAVRSESSRTTPMSRARVLVLLAQLPEAHIPADLKKLLQPTP